MNVTQYRGSFDRGLADTSRGLSPSLWGDCPLAEIRAGYESGIVIDDDFAIQNGSLTAVSTDAVLAGIPYRGFGSAGATLLAGTAAGGEFVLTEATANEAVFMRSIITPFQISSALGDLWFEARVKVSSLTNLGMICGLWDDVSCTVDIPLSASDPPIMATTGNFVGFRMPEGTGGALNAVYDSDDAGQTVDAEVVVNAACATMVADTYVKLGMRFNRRTGLMSWYVNGVKAPNSKAVPNATGTDFPADVRLGMLFGQKLVATAAGVVTIDRWTCVQLFV